MKLVDISRPEEQAAALNRIRADSGAWHAAEITLSSLEASNIVMLGRRFEKAFPALDGVILVTGADKMKVYFKEGAAPEFQQTAAGLAFTLQSAPVTAPQVEEHAEKVLRSMQGYQKAPPKSALFEHRKKRAKNVMLVADDDLLICAAMKSALGKYGDCVVVHKAGDVLDAYIDAAPDSVFLDLHLEGGTGLEGLEGIIGYDRDAYIVMLTGDSTASAATAAKKGGAKSFLSKPIVLSRLEYELFQCPTFRRYA